MDIDWQDWDDHFEQHIMPVLEKHGTTVVKKHWPFEVIEYLGIIRYPRHILTLKNKQGVEFGMHFSDFNTTNQKPLNDFLRYFERFAKCEQQLQGETDPFYSSVSGRIHTEFGKRTTIETSLGYSWICDMIRNSGRRLWTD